MVQGLDAHGRKRRGGLVGPDRINGIAPDRHQFTACLGHGFRHAFEARDRVEPGIVTQPAFAQIGRNPVGRRVLDQVVAFKIIGAHFALDLKRVASVDEDRGHVGQNHGDTGGTGKSRQPQQPVGTGRHGFALMFVRTRDDEPVQATGAEFPAQGLQTPGRRRRTGITAVADFCGHGVFQGGKFSTQGIVGVLDHHRHPGLGIITFRCRQNARHDAADVGHGLACTCSSQKTGEGGIAGIGAWGRRGCAGHGIS